MKRENISRILNGIDPTFVEECVRLISFCQRCWCL